MPTREKKKSYARSYRGNLNYPQKGSNVFAMAEKKKRRHGVPRGGGDLETHQVADKSQG